MHVEVRHAEKTYRERGSKTVQVLKDVTFDIRPGEFVCFLGPSGCGKSTLLKLIAGLEPISSGSIRCDGLPVEGASTERGVIFQDYALFPWLTVRQNLLFGLRSRKLAKSHAGEIADSFLHLFGLDEARNRYPKQLSGGMRQRVAIARALCLKPSLLLMDEPFAALDALLRQRLQEELSRIWARENITFILVTHDVEEAIYLADRIIVMTPRPGTIKEIVPVDLQRPRSRSDEAFLRLRNRLLGLMESDAEDDVWLPPPSWSGSPAAPGSSAVSAGAFPREGAALRL